MLADKRTWLMVLSIALMGCSQQPPAGPPPAEVAAKPANDPPPAGPAADSLPRIAPATRQMPAGTATTGTPEAADPTAEPLAAPFAVSETPGRAAPQGDAAPAEDTSEKAKEIVQQASKFYQGVQAFRVTATLSQKIEGADDLPIAGQDTTRTFVFAKPNKGAFRILSDAGSDGADPNDAQVAAVSDGTKLSVLIPADRSGAMKYARSDAPAALPELMEQSLVFQSLIALPLTLGLDDPAESLLEGVTSAQYVGLEELDEVPAHRLSFGQPGGDGNDMKWDLWIAAEGRPLVLQVAYDRGEQRMRTPDGVKTIRISIIDTLRGWEIDPELPEDTFVFTAPEGAKRVRSLTEPEPSPLLGKAAPPVNLPLAKDGELDLASHAGKDVVMLDFWATWCGPCVAEMPILAQVATDYAEKGVVLYAVNLREEVAEIEEFFKDKDFTATVALDAEGETADAYGAEGIPHLVIIDKKGVVQAVHVGYSPDIGEKLHKELDAILAGENIYEELLKPLDDEPADEAQPKQDSSDTPAADSGKPAADEAAAP